MKDDYTTNSHYITYTFSVGKVGRMYFLSSGVINGKHASHWGSYPRLLYGFSATLGFQPINLKHLHERVRGRDMCSPWQTGGFPFHCPSSQIRCWGPSGKKLALQWYVTLCPWRKSFPSFLPFLISPGSTQEAGEEINVVRWSLTRVTTQSSYLVRGVFPGDTHTHARTHAAGA